MIKVEHGPIEFNISPKWAVIGVQLSGGADSALLGYLLAKAIVEHNLAVRLKRITFGFGDKFDFFKNAQAVQDRITELVGKDVWVESYEVFYEKKYMHSTLEKLTYLFENKIISHTMSGRTKNPSIDDLPDPGGSRVVDRDNPFLIIDKDITEPFYNLTKDTLLSIYLELGIIDLFIITCSCDVNRNEKLLPPCGKCWWCTERNWAVKKIGL